MKKSKVFPALAAVLLAILCCSAAGCIVININGDDDSNDVSIVGRWEDNEDPEYIYEFQDDGTMDTYYIDAYYKEASTKYMHFENKHWWKYGKDTYAGYKNLYAVRMSDNRVDLFSVSDDGKKFTQILFSSDEYKSLNPTATRISN